MNFKKIIIKNFRNYENTEIYLSKGLNILYGNNGQGKTNLLESIYFLGLTKSHRSFIDDDLINKNHENCYIKGVLEKKNEEITFEIGLSKKIKKIKINDNKIKKISDYISNTNIIIFYPDDLEIIKGTPLKRRYFLNLELSQLYKNYIEIINKYNKLVKMKNNYLKNTVEIDKNYVEVINNYLIEYATPIYIIRNKFIKKINERIKNIYKDLSGINDLEIKYNTILNFEEFEEEIIKNKLKKEFKNIYDKEKKYKTSLIGPQKDDFDFYIENTNIKNFGSQGQQRMAVLALKLAEIEIFEKQNNEKPILLLDDVFSELDKNKKNNLLKYFKKDIQIIITTTDLNSLDKKLLDKAKIFKINQGKIKHEEKVKKDGKK